MEVHIIPVRYAILMQYNIIMVAMAVMQHVIYRALDCFDLPTHCMGNKNICCLLTSEIKGIAVPIYGILHCGQSVYGVQKIT